MNKVNFLILFIAFSIYSCIGYGNQERKIFTYETNQLCGKQRLENRVSVFLDKLAYNFLSRSDSVDQLGKTLSQIKKSTQLQQVFALLNQIDESVIQEHKEVASALFMHVLAVLHTYTNEMLLNILVTIDNHLSYWKEMNDYQYYYFFHKSPVKWFIGKNQQQEINDNIYTLSRLQQKYFKIVGTLTKQAQQFPMKATAEEYANWIKQFMATMQLVYKKKEDIADGCPTIPAMKHIVSHALTYNERVFYQVNKLKPPHHFIRHWLKYASLFIGVGIAYKKRDVMDAWMGSEVRNQYKESLYNAWQNYFVNPLQEIYETIMASNEQKKIDIQEGIEEKEIIIEQNKKLLVEQQNQVEMYIEEVQERKGAVLELIDNYLQEEQKRGRITNEQYREVWEEIKKNNIVPFQQLAKNVEAPNMWNGLDTQKAQDFYGNLAQFVMFHDGQKILNDVRRLVIHAHEGLINADEALLVSRQVLVHWAALLDSEFKRNQMTLRFTALIPALVTGWGLYKITSKLYGRLLKHNYTPLKNILTQINSMLITLHGDMNSECYGTLIYFLHKLKCATARHLTDKNIKREFLQDIEMLSLYDFTIEEKRLLIDNMRWKYDFLSSHHER